ncbi:unnamed protein product, partial [marine sediment metagenome]
DDPEYYCIEGDLDPACEKKLPPHLYRFVLASKRGNGVYKSLVEEKLKPLQQLQNIHLFNDEWGVKSTNCIFVTLTYDPARCGIDSAWDNIGVEFHLFCNNLKKQYGKIEVFRTWESNQNFYPHVHAIIIFGDKKKGCFNVFNHKDKCRISTGAKDKISSYWHSLVDIQGVQDTQGTIKELVKYITKDLCSSKGDKTNAMIWYHRKQSYGITKGFEDLVGSELNDIEPSSLLQRNMSNCNSQYYTWKFLGILRGVDLRLSSEMWTVDLVKPPPRVMDMLKLEQERWAMSRRG